MNFAALENFAMRLQSLIAHAGDGQEILAEDSAFERYALELFGLQFALNPVFHRWCVSRGLDPESTKRWEEIPALPTEAFKRYDTTCLPPEQRLSVFHSSGTTGQTPSKHWHNRASLKLYEASLLPWLQGHLFADVKHTPGSLEMSFLFLTPAPEHALQSSLAHMFGAASEHWEQGRSVFAGRVTENGGWAVQSDAAIRFLFNAMAMQKPVTIMGTAFSYVQLLDELKARNQVFELPRGSRALETGGYKGRSRSLSKQELHLLISSTLGVAPSHILSEYGMSELSSQAYDATIGPQQPERRVFQFPPWARAVLVSPETGLPAQEGQTGLVRVLDLANAYSAMAVQTSDLGVRRGNGFELIGRAAAAEARGCSLMSVWDSCSGDS